MGTLAVPLIHSFARGGGRHQGSVIHTLARWYTLRDEKNDSPLHSHKMLHLARWRNQIDETFTHPLTTILMEIILTLLHWPSPFMSGYSHSYSYKMMYTHREEGTLTYAVTIMLIEEMLPPSYRRFSFHADRIAESTMLTRIHTHGSNTCRYTPSLIY